MKALSAYDWPGNVRELENAVERAVTLCEGDVVRVADLPPSLFQNINITITAEQLQDTVRLPQVAETALFPLKTSAGSGEHGRAAANSSEPCKPLKNFLRDQEVAHLNRALEQSGGDKEKAALLLGISLATLYRKLAGEGES